MRGRQGITSIPLRHLALDAAADMFDRTMAVLLPVHSFPYAMAAGLVVLMAMLLGIAVLMLDSVRPESIVLAVAATSMVAVGVAAAFSGRVPTPPAPVRR